jgi:colanic acid/amylovoran biosynthesis protein
VSHSGIHRILIVNAHSQANAGDHAIALGQLQLLAKLVPGAFLTITSRTPNMDRPLLAGLGVRVIAPVFNSPSGSTGRCLPWVKTALSLIFPAPALTFLYRLIQADLVMACGGGYFYSTRRIPGLTFWQNYLQIRLAVLLKKEIVFFPQSYGPLGNPLSRRLVANLLAAERVRTVFAREQISLSVLGDLLPTAAQKSKLRFCPDMAFYFSPGTEPPALEPDLSSLAHPRVALALRDWDFPEQKEKSARKQKKDDYLEGVLAACRDLHRRRGASIVVFSQAQGPSQAEDDRRITGHVHSRLGEFVPPSQLRLFKSPEGAAPNAFMGLLAQADLLVTSRMHAAIFAFSAGTPAVVIGYQHKSLGILQMLGLESSSLPIEEIGKEALLSRCEDILQHREEWQKRIAVAVGGIRDTIEEKFQAVFAELNVRT